MQLYTTNTKTLNLDLCLKLKKQVNKMLSSGQYHLMISPVSRLKKYMTQETTETVVHGFVMSKFDAYKLY